MTQMTESTCITINPDGEELSGHVWLEVNDTSIHLIAGDSADEVALSLSVTEAKRLLAELAVKIAQVEMAR